MWCPCTNSKESIRFSRISPSTGAKKDWTLPSWRCRSTFVRVDSVVFFLRKRWLNNKKRALKGRDQAHRAGPTYCMKGEDRSALQFLLLAQANSTEAEKPLRRLFECRQRKTTDELLLLCSYFQAGETSAIRGVESYTLITMAKEEMLDHDTPITRWTIFQNDRFLRRPTLESRS